MLKQHLPSEASLGELSSSQTALGQALSLLEIKVLKMEQEVQVEEVVILAG